MFNIDNYNSYMHKFCETVKLDYFPQMQASDLLYKIITMQDLYMPVYLVKPDDDPRKFNVNYGGMQERFVPSNPQNNELDIDALIAKIDAKIAELEEAERKEKEQEQGTNTEGASDSSKETDEEDSWVKMVENTGTGNDEEDLRKSILIIRADPGSGKTTFCKKIILSVIDKDKGFFEDTLSRTSLVYDEKIMPILMMFRNIAGIKELLLEDAPFENILYCFAKNVLDEKFSKECSCDEFANLIADENQKLYLVVDGWDEIFDIELQKLLLDAIRQFVSNRDNVSIIFTIRNQYTIPDIFGGEDNNDVWDIKKFDSNEIIEYCRKYYNVIYRDNDERRKSYASVADNIIKMSKVNSQISTMARVPLTLSQLLTLSRYDGRLPENKSELYDDLLELYVGWATKKNANNISHNKMRTLLAYIAAYLTKNNKFLCSIDELKDIIRACIEDLSGIFSDDMGDDEILKLIAELEHTAIFGKGLGDSYGFAAHRTMQEYLTAYAIVTQNADAEYNDMLPLDIFRDKYLMKRWREVIVYAVLMNDGRLRQGVVNDLVKMAKEKEDDNYAYTNLLFDFILNSVPIKVEGRHQIYDLLFEKHITDEQIKNIHMLMMLENDVSKDFFEYISGKFSESVSNNSSEYGYAMAVIKASQLLVEIEAIPNRLSSIMDISQPYLLYEAEKLILNGTEEEVILGYEILLVVAWCKYANIKNVFCTGINNFTISEDVILKTKCYIEEAFHIDDIARSIKDCILAGFVSFEKIVDDELYRLLLRKLNEGENYAEILLSLGAVRGELKEYDVEIGHDIKEKYLDRLKKEITEKQLDDIIYTYSICAIFDKDIRNHESPIWKEIQTCYEGKDEGGIGKARYKQINDIDIKERMKLEPVLPPFLWNESPFSSVVNPIAEEIKSEALKEGLEVLEFNFAKSLYIARFDRKNITSECIGFIDSGYHFESISTKNNLAYLYRRGDIKNVIKIEENDFSEVNPKELLREGVQENEPFSLINHALTMANYDVELNKESIRDGLDFLINQIKDKNLFPIEWQGVLSWWTHVLLDIDDVEGMIVLYWLYKIGNLSLQSIDTKVLNALSRAYIGNSHVIEDSVFYEMLHISEND